MYIRGGLIERGDNRRWGSKFVSVSLFTCVLCVCLYLISLIDVLSAKNIISRSLNPAAFSPSHLAKNTLTR